MGDSQSKAGNSNSNHIKTVYPYGIYYSEQVEFPGTDRDLFHPPSRLPQPRAGRILTGLWRHTDSLTLGLDSKDTQPHAGQDLPLSDVGHSRPAFLDLGGDVEHSTCSGTGFLDNGIHVSHTDPAFLDHSDGGKEPGERGLPNETILQGLAHMGNVLRLHSLLAINTSGFGLVRI